MPVKPIPDGFHTVTPYFAVNGAKQFLEFLKRVFDAEVVSNAETPDGKILNAEVRIGTSMVMLADPGNAFGPMPCAMYLYVHDTDSTYKKALEAGATSIMEPANQFYGDRNAGVKDPFGNIWWIATHVEDVPPDEMKRREQEHLKKRS